MFIGGRDKIYSRRKTKLIFSAEGLCHSSYLVCYALVCWHKTTEEIAEDLVAKDILNYNLQMH